MRIEESYRPRFCAQTQRNSVAGQCYSNKALKKLKSSPFRIGLKGEHLIQLIYDMHVNHYSSSSSNGISRRFRTVTAKS